ncbi:phage tail tape measure protein [Streptomyces nigra]
MSVRVAEGTVLISAELNDSAVRRSATQAGQRAGSSFSRAFAGNSDIELDTGQFTREGRDAGANFSRGFQSRADFDQAGQSAAGDFGGSFGRRGQGEMGGAAGKFAKGFALVAVFAAVGQKVAGMVTDGFKQALERQDTTALLKAQVGSFGPEGEKLGKIGGKLWADGFAENIGDANAAIRGVKLNMRGLGVADLEGTSKAALTVAKVMDEDVTEVTRTAAKMMRTGLAKNAEEAFDLILRGSQQGANEANDLLDTFSEYSTQFRSMGLSGKQAMGLISQGLQGGARDADTVADTIKEFSIEAVQGGERVRGGFESLGLNADEMVSKFAEGGPKAAGAFDLVLDKLRNIKDPAERNAVAVELFGTKAEDMAGALQSMDLSSAEKELGNVGGASKKAADTMHGTLGSRIETFKRRMQNSIVNFIEGNVLPAWDKFSAKMGEVGGKVKTAIQPMVDFFKIHVWPTLIEGWGNLKEKAQDLADFFEGTIAPALKTAWTKVKEALQEPIEAIKEMFDDLGGKGEGLKGIWENVTGTIKKRWEELWGVVQELMTSLQEIWDKHGDKIMEVVGFVWKWLGDTIGLAMRNLWTVIKGVWTAIQGVVSGALQVIKGIIQIVTGIITGNWSKVWEGIKNVFGGVWKAIKGIVKGALDIVKGLIKNAWNFVMDKTAGLRNWIVEKWNSLKNSVVNTARNLKDGVVGFFTGLRDRAVSTFRSTRDTIWGVATWIRDKVAGAFRTLRDNAVKAFRSAKDSIKTVWDGLKSIAKKPVEFIINTVYNNGIRKVWNAVVGAFGGKKLGAVKGFARGGVLPGQSSFRNGDDQLVPMRKGEGVYVSEAMRDPYERARLHAVNKAAMQGRSLREFQGSGQGGGGFALGGIFDGIGKVASGAWDKVKKGASWLKDTFGGAVKAGVRSVVNPLINQIPGGSGFTKLLKDGARGMVTKLLGAGEKGDKEAGVAVGRGVAGALRWAKTQHGKPYQWGGAGNPSWDCSGFMSGIQKVIQGLSPKGRLWSTHAFSGNRAPKGWQRNLKSPFQIGITNAGVGHTAGTLAGTNVESRGGDGVVVGSRARGAHSSMFTDVYGFGPARAGYDNGGLLPPGWTSVYNGTRKPEKVLTDEQWNALIGSTTPTGKSVNIENLTIAVDASQLQSFQDVLDMIDSLKVTARQFGARI